MQQAVIRLVCPPVQPYADIQTGCTFARPTHSVMGVVLPRTDVNESEEAEVAGNDGNDGVGDKRAGDGGRAAEREEITCSVFDLQAHPDFSFRMGDVVLRLDAGILDGLARYCQWDPTGSWSEDGGEQSYMLQRRPAAVVGTVGEVIDVDKTGYVLVAWLEGEVTRVHPEGIYRVAIEEEMEEALFYQGPLYLPVCRLPVCLLPVPARLPSACLSSACMHIH